MSTLDEVLKQVDDLERDWNQDTDPETGLLTSPNPPKEESPAPAPLRLKAGPPDVIDEPRIGNLRPPRDDVPVKPKGTFVMPADVDYYKAPSTPPPEMERPQVPQSISTNRDHVDGSEPDWNRLAANLQGAESRAANTRTVGAMLEAVSPNFHAPANAGAEEVASARVPLEIAQARQAHELRQQQLKAAQEKPATSDPASDVSKRAREALRSFLPNAPLPPSFDNMSADEVGSFTKNIFEKQRSDNATGTEKQLADLRAAQIKNLADDNARAEAAAQARGGQLSAAQELAQKKLDEEIRHNQATETNAATKKEKAQAAKSLGAPEVNSLDEIKDPSERATVSAIISNEGRNMDTAGMMRTAAGRKLMGYVLQLDPSYNQSKYGTAKAVSTHLATDKSVDAINTSSNHLDAMEKAIAKSGLSDVPTFNKIRNALLDNSGSDALTALNTIGGTAAHEVAGAYNIATESGRHEIEKMFSASQSPDQLLARIRTQRELLAGKGQSMVHRAKTYGAQEPAIMPNVLHPDQPAPAGPVKMKFPSGNVHDVPADQVEQMQRTKGATVING